MGVIFIQTITADNVKEKHNHLGSLCSLYNQRMKDLMVKEAYKGEQDLATLGNKLKIKF